LSAPVALNILSLSLSLINYWKCDVSKFPVFIPLALDPIRCVLHNDPIVSERLLLAGRAQLAVPVLELWVVNWYEVVRLSPSLF
jgi:hypothetical protein